MEMLILGILLRYKYEGIGDVGGNERPTTL